MNIYILVLSLLATSFCYSQDTNINARSSITSFSNAGEFSSYGSGMWVSGAKDPGVDGTPYLFKNWHYRRDPTHVVFYKKKTFEVIANQRNWNVLFPSKNIALFNKIDPN